MSVTLHTEAGNFRAFKIIIAAKYNDVKLNIPEFNAAAIKDKSPSGRAPLLETPSGCIFESNAIARYVGKARRDTDFCGSTFFESGQVDSWMDFSAHELELPVTLWLYPVLGYMSANAELTAKAKADVARALTTLNTHLNDKTYLVGDKVTLADVTVASTLVYVFKFLADPVYRKKFGNVVRWFETIAHQPHFMAVVGNVALCETELTAGAGSVISTAATGGGNAKKEKKEKAPKAKEEKKEKKAPEPIEDAEPAPAKKLDHPLKVMDQTSPSAFNMDAWKRNYSNATDYKVAVDEFFASYDAEGWSIFRGDYKYNEENKVLFMTSNLIGGFMQRTDEIRKWLFGTMTIRGEEKVDMKITAYFLIRGQSIQPLIDCNEDAECYAWTKLSTPLSDAEKASVFEFWVKDDVLEGAPCLDSRCFK